SVSPTSGRNLSIIVFTESLLFIQLSSCSQAHNVFLVDLAAFQYSAAPSFLHYRNPVRQPDDLLHSPCDQDDRHAAFRQLVDQMIDFALRTDIDAPRRFIQYEDFRLAADPLADDDLLLIPS